MITFEEFQKMELCVGVVKSVEDHPNADRLLVLQVDDGGEGRQIVAGIKGMYPVEELPGKRFVLVANLQPAQLRGVESQGMLLAAEHDGKIVIMTPEQEIPPGTKVR